MASTQAFSLKTRQPIADEDALLTEEDRVEKQATEKGTDCTTRRRACKNCVCGRAQIEERLMAEGKLGPDDTLESIGGAPHEAPPGGCGNCAKGDAFRCATCPYRGQPAFDNTEDGKVMLNLNDDI